jgi:hypothetical protein
MAKSRVCRILNVARSAGYYRERDRVPIVGEVMAQRITHPIDAESYLGYWSGLGCAGRV